MALSSLEKSSLQSQQMIPVCCICKRIRTIDNHWKTMDIPDNLTTDQKITHTFCLECARRHYPFIFDD